MTYFLDLIIALTAKNWGNGVFYEIKTSFNDFIEAVKVPKYAIMLAIVLIVATSVLVYTSVSNILTPQIAKQKEMKKYSDTYESLANGNELGPKDADIVIHEYVDYNCQGCFIATLYSHRIIKEFENVKFVQHAIPLQKSCNPYMSFEGHENSCIKASYALAAKKQNKYWQMVDILFSENIKTEKEIIEAARLLDIDIKKLKQDSHGQEVKDEIKNNIEYANKNNIYGTPTFIFGVKKNIGIGSYPEYKQQIIDYGGREKQNNG